MNIACDLLVVLLRFSRRVYKRRMSGREESTRRALPWLRRAREVDPGSSQGRKLTADDGDFCFESLNTNTFWALTSIKLHPTEGTRALHEFSASR